MNRKWKYSSKYKRSIALGISLLTIMTAGCLKTPDVEYIANKEGQDTLISDNIAMDSGIPIAEQVQAPERIQAVCEKVNEYTSIEIDADVVTPNATAVPVYTVSPIEMTSETVKNYTQTLYEDGNFHNREYGIHGFSYALSVEELYEEIEALQNIIDTAEITDVSEPVMDEDGTIIEMNMEYMESLVQRIDLFQQELMTAEERQTYGSPVSYDFEKETSTVAVRVRQGNNIIQDMDGETFDYDFEHATFTGMRNGKEYELSLYRDTLNNELRFYLPYKESLDCGYQFGEISLVTDHKGSYMTKPNTCSYSQEEAVALCKDFLAELGIDNMEAQYVADIYLFRHYTMPDEEFLGKKGWRIYLYWGSGEMGDCFSPKKDVYLAESTFSSDPILRLEIDNSFLNDQGDVVTTFRTWRGMASFTVLDDGIINAWIQNPVENQELLTENVRLLDFDQVLQQGIACLETLYGDSGISGPYGRKDIQIRTIELNYARMQSPDSEDEFTMIPVWDFKTGPDGESMVAINAIDGSRFDREMGY